MLLAPPPFPEEAAGSLLDKWLPGSAVEFGPLYPDRDPLAHDRIEAYTLRPIPEDLDATHRNALDLRRAMEGVNALACCHGLGIDENPAFWRRELLPFVNIQSEISSGNFHAFASDMLSRFCVVTSVKSSPEATAWAMATCFSMDPKSEAMAVRREVHEMLSVFFTRRPPMLDIRTIPLPYGDVQRSPEEECRLIKRSLLHTGQLWDASYYAGRIKVEWGREVDGGGLLEISELVALDRVIDLRVLTLTVVEEDPSLIVNQLSSLMRAIVRIDTVRKMTWRFKKYARGCFEAIYSAIPAMKSLKSFSVLCQDMKTTEEMTVQVRPDDPHVRSYYAWLAYALVMRQLDGRSASVGVELVGGNEELFGRALQSPSVLLDDVSFDAGRKPVFLPYGSSVALRSRVVLTSDITVTERLRDPTVSLVAEQGQRVDVVALCGSRAVIVWPGCGLLCVDATDLHDWKTQSLPSFGISRSPVVSELTCSTSQAGAISAYLELIGSDLKRLEIGKIGSDDTEAFQQILCKCPRLDALIVSSLGVIEPLLSAYESGACCASTLKFGSVPNPMLHAVLQSLGDATSLMARRVSQLHIERDFSVLLDEDVEAAASVLARNRRLAYLRLCTRHMRVPGDDTRFDRLAAFVDQPCMQTRPSRRAAYTFLLAARRHRVLRSLPAPCARVIAEYAATPMRRHVSWD